MARVRVKGGGGTTITSNAHAAVRLPRAQRREQIVTAAAAAFLDGGYEKTSMEDVARAAGVTRLIVYRIFESKEALYLAVLTAVLDDIGGSFDVDADPASAERRESVAATLLGVARRHPDGFRLLWRHTSNQAEFSELYSMFERAATEYAMALIGRLLPDAVLARWAAASLVSTIYESICLWLDDGDPSRDAAFLGMLTEGVRATVHVWGAVQVGGVGGSARVRRQDQRDHRDE
jgi:AcrR family transcriptional regulator